MKNRIIKDIPELVAELRAQAARCRDFVVPQAKMEFAVDETVEASKITQQLVLRIDGKGAFRIEEQVHGQFGQKFEIPMAYYSRMRENALDLLTTNLNHWRSAKSGAKRLVRIIDDRVRGFVSDRYRPLSHLDLVTTAIQTITGRDSEKGGFAKGAICFGWHIDPKRMDVCLMNPTMVVDLKHLDRGVTKNESGGYDPDGVNHGWVRAKADRDSHFVFPAAFLGNSENGFGGLSVRVGLYEAVCDNTARMGHDLAIRHLGGQLDEGEIIFSATTQEKENAVIYAKVADIVRQAFDPACLLVNAKKMAGLTDEEVDDVKEVATEIAKLPGMTEGVRDDILSAYRPVGKKDTLLDVQRAVTAAAHAYRVSKPDVAEALESLGGDLIEKRGLALVVKK